MSFSINFGNLALLGISGCGSELTYLQERSVSEYENYAFLMAVIWHVGLAAHINFA